MEHQHLISQTAVGVNWTELNSTELNSGLSSFELKN